MILDGSTGETSGLRIQNILFFRNIGSEVADQKKSGRKLSQNKSKHRKKQMPDPIKEKANGSLPYSCGTEICIGKPLLVKGEKQQQDNTDHEGRHGVQDDGRRGDRPIERTALRQPGRQSKHQSDDGGNTYACQSNLESMPQTIENEASDRGLLFVGISQTAITQRFQIMKELLGKGGL